MQDCVGVRWQEAHRCLAVENERWRGRSRFLHPNKLLTRREEQERCSEFTSMTRTAGSAGSRPESAPLLAARQSGSVCESCLSEPEFTAIIAQMCHAVPNGRFVIRRGPCLCRAVALIGRKLQDSLKECCGNHGNPE
ncbi:hypothetical protein QQF64_028046 [Cirrhinus molitorella]|uniref:Uncharacterized protein n=1 Tax=Cirrhinus molitorella TaxID=172907 RepID=A0ABR3N5M0_9TELE